MSRFNFILKYIPGVKIGKADGLSKKLDWKVRVEESEVDIIEKIETAIENDNYSSKRNEEEQNKNTQEQRVANKRETDAKRKKDIYQKTRNWALRSSSYTIIYS